MKSTQRPILDDAQLQPWIDLLEQQAQGSVNTTIGLIAGGSEANERGALDRLAQTGFASVSGSGLLIRLSSDAGLGSGSIARRQLRSARTSEQVPTAIPSPIGPWHEVCFINDTRAAQSPMLPRWTRWLAAWKNQYARILIDLGPLDDPHCRSLGRYCDSCLLLLGPVTCPSPAWLRRYIDLLTQCDVPLSGSIVVAAAHRGSVAV